MIRSPLSSPSLGRDWRSWIVVAFLLTFIGAGCGRERSGPPHDGRYSIGDDSRWAEPGFEDSAWIRAIHSEAPAHQGVFWGRFDVALPLGGERAGANPPRAMGVKVSAVAAREVYWDGHLIGRTGTVGASRQGEVAGPIDDVSAIPSQACTPGEHTLAIRFSTLRRPAGLQSLLLDIDVGDLRHLSTRPLRSIGGPLLFLGGFILIALYYGVLFAANRRRYPYLATSALCLAVAALLVAEGWRPAFGYHYDWHATRLRIIEALTFVVGALLVGSFAVQYRLPRSAAVWFATSVASGAALIAVSHHETATYLAFAFALAGALFLTGAATLARKRGARLALLGVGVCAVALVLAGHEFMDGAFFPAFGALIAGILVSLGLQTRDEERRLAAARATAARLETELLKKHLQPHFLMNTLTSILEWVETDPPRGAQAIEALSAELRTLVDVSGEALVSMGRELDLCRAHLAVMGFRRGVDVTLDSEGVDRARLIPPAVLHTLIENAMTHNAYHGGAVDFTLTQTDDGSWRELRLSVPLVGDPRPARVDGGGLRYVRARLEESLPGQWSLKSGPEGASWVTYIGLGASPLGATP